MASIETVCPQSKDKLTKEYVEYMFNSITKNALFTPSSRSLIDETYSIGC
jgi:hypothetical protein